jgi:hypothetical protein
MHTRIDICACCISHERSWATVLPHLLSCAVAGCCCALQAHMLSMACAGVLFWSKRAKPAGQLAMLRLVVVAHAMAPAAIRWASVTRFLTCRD